MKNVITASAALLLTTSLAQAGGLDRSGNPYSVLFEEGNYAQFSFSMAKPEVSGTYPSTAPFDGSDTGNMADDYTSAGLAFKFQVNDQFDFGLFLNQPYGANSTYGAGFYDGLTADWQSNQMSVVGKYEVRPGISVYGGLRAVQSKATIAIPDSLPRGAAANALLDLGVAPTDIPMPGASEAEINALAGALVGGAVTAAVTAAIDAGEPLTMPEIDALTASLSQRLGLVVLTAGAETNALNYTAETNADTQIGYILGAAYERPEIALRVALTYESGVTHSFDSKETWPAYGQAGTEGEFEIEMPQSVTLEFQSGIAADTLAFGSIKWTEWSVWDVRPSVYETFTGGQSVTGLDNDVMTYRAGIGRRLSDELSVFGRVTYEKANGGEASRLAPTDGSISYGIGGSYTMDNIEFTGGIEYAILGDATDGSQVAFADNSALGFGMSVGFSF